MKEERILITDATRGIGKALGFQYAKHGEDLLIVARSRERLQKVKWELENRYPVSVKILSADMTEPDAAEKIYEFCKKNNIFVKCLINHAGAGAKGDFREVSILRQQQIIDLNVTSLTRLCYLFLKDMRVSKKGTIVNITPISAFLPLANQAVYAATKSYVLSFSQALYEENKKYGIKVFAMCPGLTKKDFILSGKMQFHGFKAASPKAFAKFVYRNTNKKNPIRIYGCRNRAIAWWARHCPRCIVRSIATKMCE